MENGLLLLCFFLSHNHASENVYLTLPKHHTVQLHGHSLF